MSSPFGDLIVLELASVLAGPSVGQFFAELGATVWKVENVRTGGDVTRRWTLPEEAADTDTSAYFACCNWGKQSIALDLTTEPGRNVLHRLAARCDIAIASYRPGTAEALGADAETLRTLNPQLLYAALTGYGSDDARAGYDAVIQAESGFMSLNGEADGPPLKMPVALMDVLAAHQLKEALLLALWQRERTGAGTVVEVSLLQAAVSSLVNQATNWLVAGVVPPRMGSEHPNIAPYGTSFSTAGGKAVVVAVGTDRQFQALCEVLGLDDLPGEARFATNAARVEHREALHDHLRPVIRSWRAAELISALHERTVPAGLVHDLPAVFARAQAEALVLRDTAAPRLAGLRQAAFTLDGAAPPTLAPPPAYAADTEAILRDVLAFDDAGIRRLVDVGAVALP